MARPKKEKINEEHLALFLKHLPIGKKNAMTVKAIQARTGLSDETITGFNHQALAKELNRRGTPVASCGNGFFLAETPEELVEYADYLLRHARATLDRWECVLKIVERMRDEVHLSSGGIAARRAARRS